MQWDFSAQEVVRGEVGYGVPEFRRDLYREVRENTLGWLDEEAVGGCFDVIYDYIYWQATGRPPDQFPMTPGAPVGPEFLASIREPLAPNIEMLGAILQRLIMDGVERGLPVEEAVGEAARLHAAMVVEPIAAVAERESGPRG